LEGAKGLAYYVELPSEEELVSFVEALAMGYPVPGFGKCRAQPGLLLGLLKVEELGKQRLSGVC
jgi:hypothetical protein